MPSSWQMDLELARSGSAQFTLLLQDVNSGPVDLTGVNAAIEFRHEAGDAATIATFGVKLDDNETGLLWIDQPHGQALITIYGSDFSALDGQHEIVRLSHKIRFTKSGDAPLLVFGRLSLLPE